MGKILVDSSGQLGEGDRGVSPVLIGCRMEFPLRGVKVSESCARCSLLKRSVSRSYSSSILACFRHAQNCLWPAISWGRDGIR